MSLSVLDRMAWQACRDQLARAALQPPDGPPAWADGTVTAETFDPQAYLDAHAVQLAATAGRVALTRADPLLFALTYLPHHLRGEATDWRLTTAEAHLDWCRQALTWLTPVVEPRSDRHAFVAPRECGKSTFWFLALPLWGAAHGHIRFVAAFADSADQAETHLATFRRELDTNETLRADFPKLCTPARRPSGTTLADKQSMLRVESGFTFAARGIDSSALGLKVDQVRPDVLIFDDVEPDEAKYSPYLAHKRLGTIVEAILPMNLRARVLLLGTVTMPGSIVHQLVRAGRGDPDPAEWVAEERFQVHHHDAILTDPDGTERSVWPAKWPIEFLQGIRHTRSYKKNFANDPMGYEGVYWCDSDFVYGEPDAVTRVLLEVDPAVTTKGTSDWTGLAVVGWAPPAQAQPRARCVVYHAEQVKLVGEPLRQHLLGLLARFEAIRAVRVEVNQGGELWHTVLHDMPVKLLVHTVSEPKEVRFARALDHYQRKRVQHARKLPVLEEQMVSFPRAAHDDVADAAVAAVLYFLDPPKPRPKAAVRSASYL